jgi:Ran GTPase-activating protein (RanGAP) involved in mRNA processing and transport
MIGRSENLNAVKPNIITGGEALAALLSCNTCHLQSLHLSWNLLRMDGACSLAESLAINCHLIFLDLSYNSIGQQGGELIGKSLLSNQTLKTLLLSNNALPSSACCAICVGIERNHHLESVNLDGNPIGEEGAKMFMQLPYTCGNRVKLSAQK